jgi:hypothetical protein
MKRPPRLTEQERDKIRMEELYRQVVKNGQVKPSSFFDRFDGPIKALQGIAVAIGIFATLWQYRVNSDHERKEAAQTYQKTFYENQMAVYQETVHECAILSTADSCSREYSEARQKFMRSFWGTMSMFEDRCVESKVIAFRKILLKYERKDYSKRKYRIECDVRDYELVDTVTQLRLQFACVQLAHQCRLHTIQTWLQDKELSGYNLYDTIFLHD